MRISQSENVHRFDQIHELQYRGLQSGIFDPVEYYRAIPVHHTSDLDDTNLDLMLAKELFMGEYEISFTELTSELSKTDLEAAYFNPGDNLLEEGFLQNFDKFQTKHPQLSRKLRSQTEDLVGFSN